MKIRRRTLPSGWYPASEGEISAQIAEWEAEIGPRAGKRGRAGIAPHAGWFFSGRLAWNLISRLEEADTVVVMGGHLSPGDAFRYYGEDAFETPAGPLEADLPLLRRILTEVEGRPDDAADNTVEIQLPLVKRAFPRSKVVLLRVPPADSALLLGRVLARLAKEEGRSILLIGSTDLTHYGPNYGFSPKGDGPSAVEWVENVNDRHFLEAAVGKDGRMLIDLGERTKAACSSGAAAAAAAFAEALNLKGEIIEYATSLRKHRSSSFVGYGAVLYS